VPGPNLVWPGWVLAENLVQHCPLMLSEVVVHSVPFQGQDFGLITYELPPCETTFDLPSYSLAKDGPVEWVHRRRPPLVRGLPREARYRIHRRAVRRGAERSTRTARPGVVLDS
jgi:hypothetical protein